MGFLWCCGGCASVFVLLFASERTEAADFRAGAAAVDISPQTLPAFQNGGFLQAKSDRIVDPLHARSLVISDGSETIAIVIVDSCMFPTSLCDQIKRLANRETGIPVDRILISSTHTHMAPAAMMCLGCPADEPYLQYVPERVAKSITEAYQKQQSAKVGWVVVDGSGLTHCRRWITRSDQMGMDPFGQRTVRAMMHPGYQNSAYTSPAGPVDPWLSVLSVVSSEDESPICIMANLSMHYFGGAGFSADYFGEVALAIKQHTEEKHKKKFPDFVGIMSQGTSGDLHWMDYSQPRKGISRKQYSELVANRVIDALSLIEYRADQTLGMAEKRLSIGLRTPSRDRLQWARPLNAGRGDLPPRNRPEVYAQQAEWIQKNPVAEVVLQAVRIGELGITAIPNEVYGITGLKLKRQSPLASTFNLELANGAAGYIPPPEQHLLGGYTTWPARTAGLVPEAEPLIVETLLTLLEKVAGKKRKTPVESPSFHSRAVEQKQPIAHWRFQDMTTDGIKDETRDNPAGYYGGVALFLPGANSQGFETDGYGNRAVYLAGGHVEAALKQQPKQYSVNIWFRNRLPAEIREVTACLCMTRAETLEIAGTAEGPLAGNLILRHGGKVWMGKTPIATGHWQCVTLTKDQKTIRVYLDGRAEPEIEAPVSALPPMNRLLIGTDRCGATLDGELDDVAVFDRALSGDDVASLYGVSRMVPPPRPKPTLMLEAKPVEADAREQYSKVIMASKPIAYWRLHDEAAGIARDFTGDHDARYETGAKPLGEKTGLPNFSGGRINAQVDALNDTYSIEFWFRNEMPVQQRPVTAYLFSHAIDGVDGAFGDNLGLGGTHSNSGKLIVFNGNRGDRLLAGKTMVPVGGWSHVVMVRQKQKISVYLNGDPEPEVRGDLPIEYPPGCKQILLGGRADNFANLQGMMEEIALYDRVLSVQEIKQHFDAAGVKPIPRPDQAESAKPDRAKLAQTEPQPMEIDKAIQSIHVPVGYRVELVASEPLVRDPVAIDWGPDGRLWVVEMADYPLGMDGMGAKGGRVSFLQDTDSDGRYDKSTLFADGLSFPTGVLVWGNGILVTAAPEILYLEDTTGDGKADVQRTLYSGFLEGNQQLRVNGLRWGLDNWVYCASGSHHGGYGKDSKITALKTGIEYRVGSRDFRLRPDAGLLDPLSGPSQYGRVRDDWGSWFGVQNSYPLWHYVLADQNIRRNPHYAPPNPKHQVVTPANPPVYPASKLQKRYHSFSQSGRFTSACSPLIYRDDYLFERGAEQHAFTCEPFHNLVQHNVISEDGVSFKARHDMLGSKTDFFASEDRWCRPVMVRTGPDGALWVVDMYRYMIEHPQWLPEKGQNELRPWFRSGENHGRIYRVVLQDRPPTPVKKIVDPSVSELVAMLEHSNGWQRDMAQRTLVRQAEQKAVPQLEKLLQTSPQPLARLHALWTLEGLGQLKPARLENALADPHAGVRRNAVRIASNSMVPVRHLNRLINDPDPKVRLELASSLGNDAAPSSALALGQLMVTNADHPYVLAAAMSSLNPGNVSEVLSVLHKSSVPPALLHELIGQAIAMADLETMDRVIKVVCQSGRGKAAADHFAAVAITLDGLNKRKWPVHDVSQEAKKMLQDSVQLARQCATDPEQSLNVRASAVLLLGREAETRSSDFELMAGLLKPRVPALLQQQVVLRFGQISEPVVAEFLLRGWLSYSPDLRKRVLSVIASRAEWADTLRSHLLKGSIHPAELPASIRQQLLDDPENRDAWVQALSIDGTDDRAEVLSAYRPALKLKGDAQRGGILFRKLCLNCHNVKDQGHHVGPKLESITNKTKESLLNSILDPNAAVDASYFNYSILTESGRTYRGKLETETATSITLLAAEGKRTTVLRDEIELLKASRKSVMPEGLEQELDLQDVSDLIEYVQATFNENVAQ